MAQSFAAQVDSWTRKSKSRMGAIFRDSVQRTVNAAQTPVAKGGRMPVQTSFLRNSLVASLNSPPSGPTTRAEGNGSPGDVFLVIAGAEIGDVIWAGWSAEYAKFMEARYGFRESAAQNWPTTVRAVTQEMKARIR